MGFHICEYCTVGTFKEGYHPQTSSGDVTLSFIRGMSHKWVMPDMIIHYIRDHKYLPPTDFIADVMEGHYVTGGHAQTKSLTPTKTVGYLHGEYPQGNAPDGFIERLEGFMEKASNAGDRSQTRGIQ